MDTNITVPVLDLVKANDYSKRQIYKLKPDKVCGPDGISPGLISLLIAEWIVIVRTL